MKNSLFEELKLVTNSLLDESRPAFSLRAEILQLKSIFARAGEFIADASEDIANGETITAFGVAISPTMASMCVDDFARTVQFLRGLHAAIIEQLADRTNEPFRVLYAGCGPWAPLAIPLMSLFSETEVRFTLLDIHDESIRSVATILSALGLGDRIEKLEAADASLYVIDNLMTPDLIVVEMLRAAFEAEPQIAVVTNLYLQAPGAVLIPEKLSIDLALVDQSKEFSTERELPARDRILVDTVFRFDREILETGLRPTIVTVPDFDRTRYQPMLMTTVQISGGYILRDYDSGITLPKRISTAIRPGDTIEFVYEVSGKPRLKARVIG